MPSPDELPHEHSACSVGTGNIPRVTEKIRRDDALRGAIAVFLFVDRLALFLQSNSRYQAWGLTMRAKFIVSTAAAVLVAFTVAGSAGTPDAERPTLQHFNVSIQQYVQLHRQIEQQLPLLRARSDAHEIVESSNAMASALQTIRAGAREGNIFTPAVASLLRSRIAEALDARGFTAEQVIAASLEEADAEAPLPAVNGRFPWRRGAEMWPCVLNALPTLPDELQYRIVGRDLVLIDVHANLVVDILRNAVQ